MPLLVMKQFIKVIKYRIDSNAPVDKKRSQSEYLLSV